jgi:echinoderm microtubule-associated protein-like 1/2
MFLPFSYSQPASYGKKNGVWYASPGNQGWGGGGGGGGGVGGTNPRSRKPSIIDADSMPPASQLSNSIKPSAGRVIRIINNSDHSVQVSGVKKDS